MQDRPLILIGAGGHAKVIAAACIAAGREVRGLLDDGKAGQELLGLPILGPIADASKHLDCSFVVAIGDNRTRQALAARLESCSWTQPLVHPRAFVDPDAKLSPGTVVMAGAVIQPGVQAGPHSIFNTGSTVDHDCRIGAFAHVCPGVHLAGGVTLGEGAMMGCGSCARPGASVGAWSVAGAGAAVVSAIPDGVVAVGVPARPMAGA